MGGSIVEPPADYIFKCLADHIRSLEGGKEREEERETTSTIGCFRVRECPIPRKDWNKIFSTLTSIYRTRVEAADVKQREETAELYKACRDGYAWGGRGEVERIIDSYLKAWQPSIYRSRTKSIIGYLLDHRSQVERATGKEEWASCLNFIAIDPNLLAI